MRPAFSVVFLTTLIGAGQGLFLALFAVDALSCAGVLAVPPARFIGVGAGGAVALAILGLVASFFHLGRPSRAWRSAAMWRTSWLSREVIALPAFIGATALWGWARIERPTLAPWIGAADVAICLALFVCTAMIYACIKFLQEWASPFTLANFFLIGCASGFTIAAALAAIASPAHAAALAAASLVLTAAALATRLASLARNARLRPKSTPQSAIGIAAARIEQKSQGFMGTSFATREFFHGTSPARFAAIRRTFIGVGFLLPMAILALALLAGLPRLVLAAPIVQFAGLIAERWFFLAQSNHPQNLYYRSMS